MLHNWNKKHLPTPYCSLASWIGSVWTWCVHWEGVILIFSVDLWLTCGRCIFQWSTMKQLCQSQQLWGWRGSVLKSFQIPTWNHGSRARSSYYVVLTVGIRSEHVSAHPENVWERPKEVPCPPNRASNSKIYTAYQGDVGSEYQILGILKREQI